MWWSSEGFVLYYSFPRMRWVGEAFGIPPSPSLLTNRSETIAIHSPRYSAASFLCWFEKAKAFELHAHVVFCAAAFLPVRPLSLSPSPSHSLPLSLPALKRQFRKCAKHVRWFKPRRAASRPLCTGWGSVCVQTEEQQRGETEGWIRRAWFIYGPKNL